MRLAERKGSSAVANAIIVKSGTRKNTIDRLTAFLGVTCASRVNKPADRSCRDQQSDIRNMQECQRAGQAFRDKSKDVVKWVDSAPSSALAPSRHLFCTIGV